jgi:hypothetical protein
MDEFDFVQNEAVSDIETVPEKFRGLYAEDQENGGYKLADHAKPLAQAYTGLHKNFKDAKNNKKKANDESAARRKQLQEVEQLASELEVDLEQIDGEQNTLGTALKAKIDELRSQAKNGKDVQHNIDKVRQDAEKRIGEVTQAKDKELQTMQTALQQHMVSDAATRAITAAKGSAELLLPHIERHCKVVQNGERADGTPKYEVAVLDQDGDIRTNGRGDNMTVEDLVEEMKQSEKFGRAFDSETPSGTGAAPGRQGPNPGARQQNRDNMSSTDKIAAGLKGGKYGSGRPRA